MPSTVFDHPIFPGSKIIKKDITVTNVSGAYSETIIDDRISAGMQVNKMYVEDPSVFRSDISVQTLGGSFVFSCSDVVGTTDVTLEFLKIADDPNGITSTEFNVLNNKIESINGNLTKLGSLALLPQSMLTSSNPVELSFSGVARILAIGQSSATSRCFMTSIIGSTGNCYHNDLQFGTDLSISTASGKVTFTSSSSTITVCMFLVLDGADNIAIQ